MNLIFNLTSQKVVQLLCQYTNWKMGIVQALVIKRILLMKCKLNATTNFSGIVKDVQLIKMLFTL